MDNSINRKKIIPIHLKHQPQQNHQTNSKSHCINLNDNSGTPARGVGQNDTWQDLRSKINTLNAQLPTTIISKPYLPRKFRAASRLLKYMQAKFPDEFKTEGPYTLKYIQFTLQTIIHRENLFSINESNIIIPDKFLQWALYQKKKQKLTSQALRELILKQIRPFDRIQKESKNKKAQDQSKNNHSPPEMPNIKLMDNDRQMDQDNHHMLCNEIEPKNLFNPAICSKCGQNCITIYTMRQHKKICSGQNKPGPLPKIQNDDTSHIIANQKCLLCNAQYYLCKTLIDHMKAHHSSEGLAQYMSHLNRIHGRYKCSHCNKTFYFKTDLTMHLKLTHY